MPHAANSASADDLPPFPEGLPVASLERLSLSKLRASDSAEVQRIVRACTTDGFFNLDFTDSDEGKEILRLSAYLFDVSKHIFDLPLAEKERYSMLNGTPVLGYKAAGAGKIDRAGQPDRVEFWGMATNDLTGLVEPLPAPALITPHRPVYADFMQRCHSVGTMVLDHLDVALDLPRGTLASRHRIDQPSMCQTRQLRTPPQPVDDRRTSLIPHTDFGSVTLLFNDALGGLQMLPPEDSGIAGRHAALHGQKLGAGPADLEDRKESDEGWLWVKPAPGCATVNFGDALKHLTGGLCRSVMHRVTFPPGDQAEFTRHSLAYFVRPEDGAELAPIEIGSVIPRPDKRDANAISGGSWVRGGVDSYKRVVASEDKPAGANTA